MRRSRSRSPTSAVRSNPKLWESVKSQVMRGSKGGSPGKWSARKAQLAVKMYKSRGGKYKGSRSPNNSLTKWSREKWGYISGSRGRYLPLVVRKNLSAKSRASENKRKGSRRGQWVPYGSEVKHLMRKYRITSRSRSRSPRRR
jgi:hypothetical protein